MAFLIKYSRLFEVRILHGFYLDMGDENNFFQLDENDPAELKFRDTVLKRYNLTPGDLIIEPTPSCRKILRNQRMIFRMLPTGFIVGVEAKQEILANGTIAFRPVVEIDPNTRFQFEIKAPNKYWTSFSSIRLRPNVPARFYFSNQHDTGQLNPPSLSLTAGERSPRFYEMGEIARDAADNQLYEAIAGVPSAAQFLSADHWQAIDDFRYVTYRDQMLLPSRFAYRFTPDAGQNITQASFTLSTPTDPDVATITTSGPGPFTEYFLDFKALDVQPGRYTLEATGSGGYADTKTVLIDDDLFQTDLLALVSIGHETGLPDDLKLLEDDGTLRRVGTVTSYPVFELRFKPRITYWRYIFHPGQDEPFPSPPPGSDVETDPANNQRLVTIRPLPITKAGSRVNFSPVRMLPNPNTPEVAADPLDAEFRHFSDIYLDKIEI
jgi:hypothetical protein